MENYRGPTIHRAPGEGIRYRVGEDENSAFVTIKVSHQDPGFTQFSCVEYELPAQSKIPVHSYRWTDRVFICSSGEGYVALGNVRHEFQRGTVIYCGHGVPLLIEGGANSPSRFLCTSYPPGPEARVDFLAENADGELAHHLSAEAKDIFGILDGSFAEGLPDDRRGHAVVVQADAGKSYWQADPTAGYISNLLTRPDFPINALGVGLQMLEKGAFVREHGHNNTDEIIYVIEGEGTVYIDGVGHNFDAGAMAVLGRNVLHRIVNEGVQGFRMTGIFNPPGVDQALKETGVKRLPGSIRPQGIPRNAETERLLVERYGFIIPGAG